MSRRPRFTAPAPSLGDGRQKTLPLMAAMVRTCRACGCTDADCRQCIARTGFPCRWVAVDLCSACVERQAA